MVLYCLDVLLSPLVICKSKMLDYLKQMTHLATQTQNVSRMATVAPPTEDQNGNAKRVGRREEMQQCTLIQRDAFS
jgi:hypothetical protein